MLSLKTRGGGGGADASRLMSSLSLLSSSSFRCAEGKVEHVFPQVCWTCSNESSIDVNACIAHQSAVDPVGVRKRSRLRLASRWPTASRAAILPGVGNTCCFTTIGDRSHARSCAAVTSPQSLWPQPVQSYPSFSRSPFDDPTFLCCTQPAPCLPLAVVFREREIA